MVVRVSQQNNTVLEQKSRGSIRSLPGSSFVPSEHITSGLSYYLLEVKFNKNINAVWGKCLLLKIAHFKLYLAGNLKIKRIHWMHCYKLSTKFTMVFFYLSYNKFVCCMKIKIHVLEMFGVHEKSIFFLHSYNYMHVIFQKHSLFNFKVCSDET